MTAVLMSCPVHGSVAVDARVVAVWRCDADRTGGATALCPHCTQLLVAWPIAGQVLLELSVRGATWAPAGGDLEVAVDLAAEAMSRALEAA